MEKLINSNRAIMKFMNKKIGLTVFLIGMVFSNTFAGGGWTQEKGNGYFKLSTYFVKADSHFTSMRGELDPNATIGFLNTAAYIEYGITDRWTVVSNISLFARNYVNSQVSRTTGEVITPGEATNGIGDIDVAIKYGIYQSDRFVFAGTLLLGIPSGKIGQGEMGILQLGDGEFNQMIRFDASTPWKVKNSPMYANAYVGFNHRTRGFSEEFRWGAEIGVGYNKRTSLDVCQA